MDKVEQARALLESNRKNRAAGLAAHEDGRHGDGTIEEVVLHWAPLCADCDAVRHYVFPTRRKVKA